MDGWHTFEIQRFSKIKDEYFNLDRCLKIELLFLLFVHGILAWFEWMYLSFEDILEFMVSNDVAEEQLLLELGILIWSTSPVRLEDKYESCLRVLGGFTSPIKLEQTVEREFVEPPFPIKIERFWRSSTGRSESLSLFNRKQRSDTIALDSKATIDNEPKMLIIDMITLKMGGFFELNKMAYC